VRCYFNGVEDLEKFETFSDVNVI